MRVPTLQQRRLLLCGLIDSVIHEHLARHVSEGRVEAASDKDASIIQTNGHSIALQDQVLWHKFLAPTVLRKVILKDHLRVIGVPKEVVFRDWLHFVIEELECVLVRKLDDIVLECSNVFEKLCRHYSKYRVRPFAK